MVGIALLLSGLWFAILTIFGALAVRMPADDHMSTLGALSRPPFYTLATGSG